MLGGDRSGRAAGCRPCAATMQASASSPRTGSAPRRRRWRRRGVLVEDALDLERRDVLAAAPDHVLAPVDEVEVAFGRAADDVAGVEPVVGPRLGGRLVVLQVAGEEVLARVRAGGADEQLAGNVDRGLGALGR